MAAGNAPSLGPERERKSRSNLGYELVNAELRMTTHPQGQHAPHELRFCPCRSAVCCSPSLRRPPSARPRTDGRYRRSGRRPRRPVSPPPIRPNIMAEFTRRKRVPVEMGLVGEMGDAMRHDVVVPWPSLLLHYFAHVAPQDLFPNSIRPTRLACLINNDSTPSIVLPRQGSFASGAWLVPGFCGRLANRGVNTASQAAGLLAFTLVA